MKTNINTTVAISVGAALALFGATTSEAAPVTYAYTGTITSSEIPAQIGQPVTGTITIDFANEFPAQSKGSVGSPAGWTSTANGGYGELPVPSGFVFTMTDDAGFNMVWTPTVAGTYSSISVNSAGITASAENGDPGYESAGISYSNPSGAMSANGMPLFDMQGTGTGNVARYKTGISFSVDSLTLVPPPVMEQLNALTAEAVKSNLGALTDAQSSVQSACIYLQNSVSEEPKQKGITAQKSAQFIFDAKTAEAEIGCQ